MLLNFLSSSSSSSTHLFFPAEQAEAGTVIGPAFYDLVRSIILNQWKFFFPQTVVTAKSQQMGGGSPTHALLATGHLSEFTSLLEIIVSAFTSSDLDTFKTNLETLQVLNEKKNLFSHVRMFADLYPRWCVNFFFFFFFFSVFFPFLFALVGSLSAANALPLHRHLLSGPREQEPRAPAGGDYQHDIRDGIG